MEQFFPLAKEEANWQRVCQRISEIQSETIAALQEAFEELRLDRSLDFKAAFMTALRASLRKQRKANGFLCIEDQTIEDPHPNPEEEYIQKEQIALVKERLGKDYSAKDVEFFFRYYGDGKTLEELGEEDGISAEAMRKRLKKMFLIVSKYMRRINDE